MKKLRIFISYAHAEKEIKELFVSHLKNPTKNRQWEIWDDTMILPGDVWDDVIKKELEKADVIILLVTLGFLNSDYIEKIELLKAYEKWASHAGKVIPIKVGPCVVDEYLKITRLQWVNLYDDKDSKKNLNNAKNENARSEIVADGVARVLTSLDAYAESLGGTDAADGTADDRDEPALKTLHELDPKALIIAVRNKRNVYLLPPESTEVSQAFPISEQWLPQRAFAIIQRLVAKRILDENEYEALGEAFYYRLFPQKPAQDAFRELYLKHAVHRQEDNPLKIILHFDRASADLASLPWEYLWLPFPENEQPGFFVGAKNELVLTRRLSTAGEKGGVLPQVDKIRILLAFSKPSKPPAEAALIEKEAEEIENYCKTLSHIEIKKQELHSSKALQDLIAAENKPFQIVHFIGKSRSKNEGGKRANEIAFFSDPQKAPEWLSPESFVQCFGDKKPNFLFFNVTRDNTDFCDSLRDIALQVIDKVDGVLSIQTPVESDQSTVFAKELYAALAQGKDLDVAAAAAARQVAKQSRRLYGISASFSRRTLKMELPKPAAEGESLFAKSDYCPNYHILDASGKEKCTQRIKIGPDGEPVTKICPGCGIPLSVCPNPNCRHLVSLNFGVCYLCTQVLKKPTGEPVHEKQTDHEKSPGISFTRTGGLR